jgi:DNA replication protein DnaC
MTRFQPLLPKIHGKPHVDDRRVLSGAIFFNRNGLRWRENVIALGPSGTGKTQIALGLGLSACQKGLSVGFVTAALVHELMEARDAR